MQMKLTVLNFLKHMGNKQIKEMCQSFIPIRISQDWIEIKSAITAIDLTKCSFLKKFCLLTNKTVLSANMGLTMISRIATLSPHNIYTKYTYSYYSTFCVCYPISVGFIEFLRILYEICVKMLRCQVEILHLKN